MIYLLKNKILKIKKQSVFNNELLMNVIITMKTSQKDLFMQSF